MYLLSVAGGVVVVGDSVIIIFMDVQCFEFIVEPHSFFLLPITLIVSPTHRGKTQQN